MGNFGKQWKFVDFNGPLQPEHSIHFKNIRETHRELDYTYAGK